MAGDEKVDEIAPIPALPRTQICHLRLRERPPQGWREIEQHDEKQGQGGREPKKPPRVEVPVIHSRGLTDRLEQDSRDQKSRKDEEEIDAHPAPRKPAGEPTCRRINRGVREEDSENREPADSVESGHTTVCREQRRRHVSMRRLLAGLRPYRSSRQLRNSANGVRLTIARLRPSGYARRSADELQGAAVRRRASRRGRHGVGDRAFWLRKLAREVATFREQRDAASPRARCPTI